VTLIRDRHLQLGMFINGRECRQIPTSLVSEGSLENSSEPMKSLRADQKPVPGQF
jgi:hypothetical protein